MGGEKYSKHLFDYFIPLKDLNRDCLAVSGVGAVVPTLIWKCFFAITVLPSNDFHNYRNTTLSILPLTLATQKTIMASIFDPETILPLELDG